MISSLLIANRGEIACRIIKTARRMNIRTIAVFSEADRNALHVRLADEAVFIGPAAAAESYLRHEAILDAAQATKAEAIHPGYGFLSENAEFAEKCEQAGLVFVGPPASAIKAMGLKDEAKALMEKSGVPVVPGYHGVKQDAPFLKNKAYETGYPVLLKAVAGGGGKGMRRIDKAKDFEAALEAVKREAESAFGDPHVLLEKFVTNPRHIEIQVFADQFGNAVHLFERDCSAQRRHQKVIEEAPAPGMTDAVRTAMGKAAVDAAQAVGYRGAGTVEFIVDGSDGLKADGFWFMEMNTRLQVEHPVTEAITGVDLVEWQIRIASGEPLPLTQDAIECTGHAIEARIYAEDPETGFLPSTGRLELFRLEAPSGVRIDTGVVEGDEISPFYDPMIAKVITHGANRDEALDRMLEVLSQARIAGPKSNVGFLNVLLAHHEVRTGGFDTGLIDREFSPFVGPEIPNHLISAGIHAIFSQESSSEFGPGWRDPWSMSTGFQLCGQRSVGRPVEIDGNPTEVRLSWAGDKLLIDDAEIVSPGAGTIMIADGTVHVFHEGCVAKINAVDPLTRKAEAEGGEGGVKAPMTGKMVVLSVAQGDRVEAGTFLFAVEAMKMEHAVSSAVDGVVVAVHAELGTQVEAGAIIIEIGPEEADPVVEADASAAPVVGD